jgi:site-specific DNA-methyltransferase (adenine-specific)
VSQPNPPAEPVAAPIGNTVHFGDNLTVMRTLPAGLVDLIYVDPPFNTGRVRQYTRLRATRDDHGHRTGFGDRRYTTLALSTLTFGDVFDDYLAWLEPRLLESHRLLSPRGTLYFHIDFREVHYCKVLLDRIFGRDCFLNEIIWAYDYGGRTRRRWPPKHDNILVYVRDPRHYTFNVDAVDRIPYMAPALVGPAKAARGKLPTDTWWHTIVPTSGGERTGYPTQKPLAILERIIAASSNPGDLVLDFCAGSGTTGEAAHRHGRRFYLIDNYSEAMVVMERRLGHLADATWIGWPLADNVAPG